VAWQTRQLAADWTQAGVPAAEIDSYSADQAGAVWQALVEVPHGRPLIIKANLRPSAVTSFMQLILQLDPAAYVQAHAGNGIVVAGLSAFSVSDAGRVLVQTLQPAAQAAGGNAVVWSCSSGELTRQASWGAIPAAGIMRSVKNQFDPKGLLNPGRFV
jgi:FAD/FMN-containing dehydrogenase